MGVHNSIGVRLRAYTIGVTAANAIPFTHISAPRLPIYTQGGGAIKVCNQGKQWLPAMIQYESPEAKLLTHASVGARKLPCFNKCLLST